MKYFDSIFAYFEGEMNPREKREFEEELKNNQQMQTEYSAYENVNGIFRVLASNEKANYSHLQAQKLARLKRIRRKAIIYVLAIFSIAILLLNLPLFKKKTTKPYIVAEYEKAVQIYYNAIFLYKPLEKPIANEERKKLDSSVIIYNNDLLALESINNPIEMVDQEKTVLSMAMVSTRAQCIDTTKSFLEVGKNILLKEDSVKNKSYVIAMEDKVVESLNEHIAARGVDLTSLSSIRKDYDSLSMIYAQLSLTYLSLDNYEKSLEFREKSLSSMNIFRSRHHKLLLSYREIGLHLYSLKEYRKALKYQEKAIFILMQQNNFKHFDKKYYIEYELMLNLCTDICETYNVLGEKRKIRKHKRRIKKMREFLDTFDNDDRPALSIKRN